MDQKFTQEQKYILTRKRVEKMSKFYKHLAIYIIVNLFLSAIFITGDVRDGNTLDQALLNYNNYRIWLYWGIGIAIQALNTFGLGLIFNKDWEERKVKEYMNDGKIKS